VASMVLKWDERVEDGALQPEPIHASADEFVRKFLVMTSRREVIPKGDFAGTAAGGCTQKRSRASMRFDAFGSTSIMSERASERAR
jgi:hypothetical protein